MKNNVQVTFSKVFALLLLISGTFVSLKLKSESIFVTTIIAGSSIVANKQFQDRIKSVKSALTTTETK